MKIRQPTAVNFFSQYWLIVFMLLSLNYRNQIHLNSSNQMDLIVRVRFHSAFSNSLNMISIEFFFNWIRT